MTYRRTILVAMALSLGSSGVATGAEITMICKNPRREHLLTYDSTSKILLDQAEGANAAYRVVALRTVGGGPQVKGRAVTKGFPDMTASFGRPKRLIVSMDGKVIQTESCR